VNKLHSIKQDVKEVSILCHIHFFSVISCLQNNGQQDIMWKLLPD